MIAGLNGLNCVLEIDYNRNVIYVHSQDTGCTILRMQIDKALPLPRPNSQHMQHRNLIDAMAGTAGLLDVRIMREVAPDGETPINTAHVSWGDG